jgi:tRNA threonylcarbamoyladenosine biosynthesis protein TsaB
MAYILSIETSTKICSVAIHKDGQLIASQKLMQDKSHSGLLAVLIKDIVKYAGLKIDQLSALAVAEGPGSYTGLRIGTSTAKGICFAHDIPLLAISSLESMALYASNFNFNGNYLCPMIDARRMEAYCMIFNKDVEVVKEIEAVVFEEGIFREISGGKDMLVFGDGVNKFEDIVRDDNNIKILSGIDPIAEHMGGLAFKKFQNKDFVDLAYFEPFYLKDFRVTKPKNS